MTTRTALIAALSTLLLAACSENDLRATSDAKEPLPDIEVTPLELDFGSLTSDQQEVRTFNVANVGKGTLHIDDIVLETGESFSLLAGDLSDFDLPAGEARDIAIAFTPMLGNDNFGQAIITSDDPDEAIVPVDLLGFGEVPSLVISPDPMNFGDVMVACGDLLPVTLTNAGPEDLVIDAISYKSMDGSMAMFDSNVLPLVLAQNSSTTVDISFNPMAFGKFDGEMLVTSNDPRGLVAATQYGKGIYDGDGGDSFATPDEEVDTFSTATGYSDSFVVPTEPPVDILFAVDQSCSMSDQTVPLGNAFSTFINTLNTVTSGWHVGVVTNDNGCFNSGVLTASNPSYPTLFNNAVNSGGCTNGSPYCDTEALLKLTDTALSKTGTNKCNANFLRPGALLHVIVVSDEEEQSGNGANYWLNRFDNYVSHPSLLKVSAIADINNACGTGSGATGYREAAINTGGELLDVCTSAWAQKTQDLALASLAAINEYTLSQQAQPASVEVTVDGSVWNSGWTYNASTNAVVFTTPPPEGANLSIDYLPAAASNSYGLSTAANPSTIKVKVDGVRWNSGWHYDSGANAVVFDSDPGQGATIRVSYQPANAPDSFTLQGAPDPATIEVIVDGARWNSGWYYDAATNEVVFTDPLPPGALIDINYGEFGVCP